MTTAREITLSEAREIALTAAKRVLKDVYPGDESLVFESEIALGENLWIFFRNRKLSLPEIPEGTILRMDAAAYAVSKAGVILIVEDNFEDKEKLDEQLKGLSRYFGERYVDSDGHFVKKPKPT